MLRIRSSHALAMTPLARRHRQRRGSIVVPALVPLIVAVLRMVALICASSTMLLPLLVGSSGSSVCAFSVTPNDCFGRRRQPRRGMKTVFQQSSTTVDSPSSASSPSADNGGNSAAAAAADSSVNANAQQQQQQQQLQLDLPWNDNQRWALLDKVARFTVQVPRNNDAATTATKATANGVGGGMKVFVLWRNLVQETPELQGYPLAFLAERLQEERLRDRNEAEEPSLPLFLQSSSWDPSSILPYLDQYSFEANGGLTGLAYGVPGVADGTRLQTTPVGNVEVTIPKSFVCAADGSVLYELGQPAEANDAKERQPSIDGSAYYTKHWQKNGKELAAAMLATTKKIGDPLKENGDNDGVLDPELINLAGMTAVVLAGAAAVETLSHHLTVNIFWV